MTTTDIPVPAPALHTLLSGVLAAYGTPPDIAATVAELLVEADLRGVDSHGANLLALYVSRLRAGLIKPDALPRVVDDRGTTMLLDGGLGFGQVAGLEAVRLGVERSGEHGLAAVAVREGTHLGALAAYTERAARAGRICLCFQNGPTIVPPYGGVTPVFSTNPLSYAVPSAAGEPVVYDVATTAVAGNKLLLAKKRGDREIPEGWANDVTGRPTTDPAQASVNHLQWFGAHKGFGLALLVEVLSGVLTGSGFGRSEHTASPAHGAARVAKGFLFVFLDPERFMAAGEFAARMDELVVDLRSCDPAPGFDRVRVPGEIENARRAERERDGIPLSSALVEELNRCAEEAAVPPLAV